MNLNKVEEVEKQGKKDSQEKKPLRPEFKIFVFILIYEHNSNIKFAVYVRVFIAYLLFFELLPN